MFAHYSIGRRALPQRATTPSKDEAPGMPAAAAAAPSAGGAAGAAQPPPTVIPAADSLLVDLLDLDLGPSSRQQMQSPVALSSGAVGAANMDPDGIESLLGLGPELGPGPAGAAAAPSASGGSPTNPFDILMGGPIGGSPSNTGGSPVAGGGAAASGSLGLLSDVFGLGAAGAATTSTGYMPPYELVLPASKGKGLEIMSTFARRGGAPVMELKLENKALSAMGGFAIQFNKNSFALSPAQPFAVPGGSLAPRQSVNVSLPLNTSGTAQRMEPLMLLQIAVKNNVDVFYMATQMPVHVLFCEDGEMDKRVFLQTWKDIASQNEEQFALANLTRTPGTLHFYIE